MSSQPAEPSFRVRSFTKADGPVCQHLYVDGHIGGSTAANDTGFDMSDIDAAYMRSPGGHFWVAENGAGEVVGMIGVQQHEPGVGEVRRLRVRQDSRRRGIGSMLVETALRFCQDRGYVKVALDTFMEREPAINLFRKFRFSHQRTRQIGSKDLLYFYLDLYASDARKPDNG